MGDTLRRWNIKKEIKFGGVIALWHWTIQTNTKFECVIPWGKGIHKNLSLNMDVPLVAETYKEFWYKTNLGGMGDKMVIFEGRF